MDILCSLDFLLLHQHLQKDHMQQTKAMTHQIVALDLLLIG